MYGVHSNPTHSPRKCTNLIKTQHKHLTSPFKKNVKTVCVEASPDPEKKTSGLVKDFNRLTVLKYSS